jgi:hypothetical protein
MVALIIVQPNWSPEFTAVNYETAYGNLLELSTHNTPSSVRPGIINICAIPLQSLCVDTRYSEQL